MILKKKEQSCCSGPSCCNGEVSKTEQNSSSVAQPTQKVLRQIKIDFLFLDLEVCTRCQGTDDALDEAVAEVSQVLGAAGVEVLVNKVNVNTKELAIQYQFISSPTIRINGRDIDMDVKESLCESCGDLCGDTVDCRVWTWQGTEYTQPPKAMIVNALLQAVYGSPSETEPQSAQPYQLSENLKHFYEVMDKKEK